MIDVRGPNGGPNGGTEWWWWIPGGANERTELDGLLKGVQLPTPRSGTTNDLRVRFRVIEYPAGTFSRVSAKKIGG